jgi:hypothetical protein
VATGTEDESAIPDNYIRIPPLLIIIYCVLLVFIAPTIVFVILLLIVLCFVFGGVSQVYMRKLIAWRYLVRKHGDFYQKYPLPRQLFMKYIRFAYYMTMIFCVAGFGIFLILTIIYSWKHEFYPFVAVCGLLAGFMEGLILAIVYQIKSEPEET